MWETRKYYGLSDPGPLFRCGLHVVSKVRPFLTLKIYFTEESVLLSFLCSHPDSFPSSHPQTLLRGEEEKG